MDFLFQAIHGIGAVCQFTIDISNNSPFTGLFKAGETVSGLIRMGSAKDSGFVPGVSVKMLRTGTKSANLMALFTLDELPNNNHNFFAVPLSNHIANKPEGLETKIAARRFCYATGTQKFFIIINILTSVSLYQSVCPCVHILFHP